MAKNNFYKIDGDYARKNNLVTYVDIECNSDDGIAFGFDLNSYETVPVVILNGCVFYQVFEWLDDFGLKTKEMFFLCSSTPDLFQEYDFVKKSKDY